MTNTITADWKAYIDAADNRWLKAAMHVAGDALAEQRKQREQLAAEVAALKLELAELRGRIVEREASKRLSAVPSVA
jgi:hypothetical protein